jgi:tetratricopeptide (TPR) repeat protein
MRQKLAFYTIMFLVFFNIGCHSSPAKIKAEYYYDLGNSYYENADLARAEAMYLKVIKLNNRHVDCYTQLGYVYYFMLRIDLDKNNMSLAKQHYNMSYNCFQESLKYKSEARIWLGLAMLYMADNKTDAAFEAADKARSLQVDDVVIQAQCHFLKGRCYNLQGKYEDAVREFKEYIRLMPTGQDTDKAKMAIQLLENELKKKDNESAN